MANTSKTKVKKFDEQTVRTPKCRAAYLHLDEPGAFGENDPKYSIVLLIPKTESMAGILKARKYAKISKWGKKESEWPKCHNPIGDGDKLPYSKRDGHKGHWVINASCDPKRKPDVIDKTGNTISEATGEMYPGCYVMAELFAYAWDFQGAKFGVSFGLNSVLKVADGKSFINRRAAKDAFADLIEEGDSPANEEEAVTEDEEEDSGGGF